MKTVVMKPYLSYLPKVDDHDDNDTVIRNSLIGTFLNKLKEQDTGKGRKGRKNQLGPDLLKIYYARLNIMEGNDATDKIKRHQKNRKSIFDINTIDQNNTTTKISKRRF